MFFKILIKKTIMIVNIQNNPQKDQNQSNKNQITIYNESLHTFKYLKKTLFFV